MDGSLTIVITTPTPSIQNLPVELSGFTVSLDRSDVILNWTTLSESGNARFEIQQRAFSSRDSAPFRTVGSVEGQGTTSEATDYRFRVSDLAPGTYQFRLRQVDIDGGESFSGMRTATIGLSEAFALSPMAPHPVQAKSSSMLQVQRAGVVTVELYDLLGRRVQVLHDGPMQPTTPLALTVDAERLPSGVYFLRARGEGFQATQRISVVR